MDLAAFSFIGMCLEGFLCGIYSGIFAMYLQGASKKDTNKRINVIFYALCVLYVLSVGDVVVDTASYIYANPTALLHTGFIQGTLAGCCDFIAQSILIYRCWIVWGCNIRVVILPSILAFVYLVTWLASNSSQRILSDQFVVVPDWGYSMYLAGTTMSMTVNALVTCLIGFKIFKIYREVKSTSDDPSLGATGGRKIRTVMFIVIESGMILFSIQLARLMATVFQATDAGFKTFDIVFYIHQMLNGITPTIILVRVSMGLSFYDKESLIESTIGSLHFVANNPNSISETETETENVGIVNRDDDIGVQQSDDIEMVDR
ncbi:hypothetical protein BYT27DRAFT_7154988 [Phlegmacium glaucopus]|nr:hypothetical protein BYT27DRAFT_7154988 [Phlegmacium glaucopus]